MNPPLSPCWLKLQPRPQIVLPSDLQPAENASPSQCQQKYKADINSKNANVLYKSHRVQSSGTMMRALVLFRPTSSSCEVSFSTKAFQANASCRSPCSTAACSSLVKRSKGRRTARGRCVPSLPSFKCSLSPATSILRCKEKHLTGSNSCFSTLFCHLSRFFAQRPSYLINPQDLPGFTL